MFLNDAPYYIDLKVKVDIGIHFLEEEYKLIDYSHLHLFEGYNSIVMTADEFYTKYGYNRETCNIAQCIAELSREERKTIVVKTDHSAVIADLKYIYFSADYVKA